MKLANGNTFDVSDTNSSGTSGLIGCLQIFAATQPSFLQQAVVLDSETNTMSVLGPITRRFVATPDLDELLNQAAQTPPPPKEKKMDVD
jgi:DNA-directed RNA polymerase III subunit RPC4